MHRDLPVMHCSGVHNSGLQKRENVKVLMSNWDLITEDEFFWIALSGFQFFYCHKIG